MRKVLLLMILISGVSHADYISTMLPAEREALFVSMVEVADTYLEIGKTSKSTSFYRSAVNIYPIGDEAHRIAMKVGVTLDDDKTYANFVKDGDNAFRYQQYDVALVGYLMADELYNSPELYKKISDTYVMLGDDAKAEHYQNLIQQSSHATVVSE